MRIDDRELKKRKRERALIIILVVVFIALLVFEYRLSRVSSLLPFVNSIFFFGLVNLNLIILIALLLLVVRNVGKLVIERRKTVLGSSLKTKLVISFLGFSIVPTLVLFVVSVLYINSSFDKWFSLKIQNTLQASLDITRVFYKSADQSSAHFANLTAKGLAQRLYKEGLSFEAIGSFLETQRKVFDVDGIEYYPGPLEQRYVAASPLLDFEIPRVSIDILDQVEIGNNQSLIHHVYNGDLVRVLVPVRPTMSAKNLGVIVVSKFVPVTLVNKVDEISNVIQDYKEVNPLRYPVKTVYLLILVLITLVMIFVAIWMGIYIARQLTVPVEKLVMGVREVGAGNLAVQLPEYSGQDEIALLIDSFNKMTLDLRGNREKLEKQKQEIEAVLANVGTGVLAMDLDGTIQVFNRAMTELLNISASAAIGKKFTECLSSELDSIKEFLNKSLEINREGQAQELVSQIQLRQGDTARTLAAIATPVEFGVVVVLDDMTFLMKSQREMAWREVARRMAHEIKNPLTPIKLSAQRMQRQLRDLTGKEGALIRECTQVIIRHTDALKELVNEFSNFARLPEIQPTLGRLDLICAEVMSLYRQAHSTIDFVAKISDETPEFYFDQEQIRRVLINLLDNAVAALKDAQISKPSIKMDVDYNRSLRMVAIVISDNGPGIVEEVMNRIFEPYFSTKESGTGLGLAIAKRIVSDHQGYIRVQSIPGNGTQFVIELPTVKE